MTKLIWLTPCLVLTSCAANVPASSGSQAVAAAPVADAACGANSYSYLIGQPATDARGISDRDYRLTAGAVAATRPGRVTLVYDSGTQRITDIRCG
jgi:hypothetical protein